jgi:hypothetical protein
MLLYSTTSPSLNFSKSYRELRHSSKEKSLMLFKQTLRNLYTSVLILHVNYDFSNDSISQAQPFRSLCLRTGFDTSACTIGFVCEISQGRVRPSGKDVKYLNTEPRLVIIKVCSFSILIESRYTSVRKCLPSGNHYR